MPLELRCFDGWLLVKLPLHSLKHGVAAGCTPVSDVGAGVNGKPMT